MWKICYLSLGSNINNRLFYLKLALFLLKSDKLIYFIKKSNIYNTKPYGNIFQNDFLNCVFCIKTIYSPFCLLKKIKKIENFLKRKRNIKWGPRTIDIDILLFENLIIKNKNLIIPHKEILKRSFVLKPLLEVYLDKKLFGKKILDLINLTGNKKDVFLTKKKWR